MFNFYKYNIYLDNLLRIEKNISISTIKYKKKTSGSVKNISIIIVSTRQCLAVFIVTNSLPGHLSFPLGYLSLSHTVWVVVVVLESVVGGTKVKVWVVSQFSGCGCWYNRQSVVGDTIQ